jgi:hypothetical protein
MAATLYRLTGNNNLRCNTLSKTRQTAKALLRATTVPLGAVLALTAFAASSAAGPIQSFYNNGRTYCDATLLAKFWKVDAGKAKVIGGQMIERGQGRFIPGKLAIVRREIGGWRVGNRNICPYHWDYQYKDAAQVAKYWKSSIGNAKDWMSKMLFRGKGAQIRHAIAQGRAGRTYR